MGDKNTKAIQKAQKQQEKQAGKSNLLHREQKHFEPGVVEVPGGVPMEPQEPQDITIVQRVPNHQRMLEIKMKIK